MSLTKVTYSMIAGTAKNFSGYLTLNAAITDIGSDDVLLVIDEPAFVEDGTTVTVPANVAVLIQPGCSISRAAGGASTTTIIFEGALETYDGVFTGLDWEVRNSFIFHGDFADIDPTRFTFYPAVNVVTEATTFGNVNILSGSAKNTKLIPTFDDFPSTGLVFSQNREGTVTTAEFNGHSKATPGYGGGDPLFQMNKLALYTNGFNVNAVKRWDIDTGLTNNTSLWTNQRATIFRGSGDAGASGTCLIVNGDTPAIIETVGANPPTYSFNPATSTSYIGSGAVIRRDNTFRTMVLENRNGVTGDTVGLVLSLDSTANSEQDFATIQVIGVEQASPNFQGRLDISTKFQADSKLNLSMTREFVVVNGDVASTSGASLEVCARDTAEGQLLMRGTDSTQTTNAFRFYMCSGAFGNSAENVLRVGTSTTTGRSINAGGTINASGSDYAEYMEKAGDFEIAKGDICGVDANGKLTNVFTDSLSFVVKSTDPSYVGNDAWAKQLVEPVEPKFVAPTYSGLPNPGQKPVINEPAPSDTFEEDLKAAVADLEVRVAEWQKLKDQHDADKQKHHEDCIAAEEAFKANEYAKYEIALAAYKEAHEQQRQRMDRIAFCGQVPVNVYDAKPGDYIVPVEQSGGITGIAVSNPTFEQYRIAVGKVIAIEADGRAKIIVKIS